MVFDFRFTQIKLLPDGFAKLETFAVANRSPFTRSIDDPLFPHQRSKGAVMRKAQPDVGSIIEGVLVLAPGRCRNSQARTPALLGI